MEMMASLAAEKKRSRHGTAALALVARLNSDVIRHITEFSNQRDHCNTVLAWGLPQGQVLLRELLATVVEFKFSPKKTESIDAKVGLLARSCPHLVRIDLSECSWVTDVTLGELAKHFPNLQSINLAYCDKVTDGGVSELAKYCPKLLSINLYYCDKVTDVGVGELAKHCPQLQSINLSWCKMITDAGLGELAKHCPNCKVTRRRVRKVTRRVR